MLGNILAVGLMSMGMGLSGVKDEPKMYAQDEATYTITYNAEDWNESAQEIYDWLKENDYKTNWLEATIVYTQTNDQTVNLTKIKAEGTTIVLNNDASIYRTYQLDTKKWVDPTNSDTEKPINNISITSQTYYEGLQKPSMGSSIIGSITSGLGIIGALATTFLTGFSNLFYSSGALTPFAIFALVMLGISVSFAVVKLVLNLIRSNTGA